jgi:murein DD-endopeptidase MepM/ murein hydrolase activator NlpD
MEKITMSSYTIKSGDSLSKIAKKYGISIGKIMAANDKIKSADHIKAGQTITLPEQGIIDRAARYINYRKTDNPYDGYKKTTKKSTSTLTNPSDGGKAKLQAEKKSKKIVGNPGKGNEMTKSSVKKVDKSQDIKIPKKNPGGSKYSMSDNQKTFQLDDTKKKKKKSPYWKGTKIKPTQTQKNRMIKNRSVGT